MYQLRTFIRSMSEHRADLRLLIFIVSQIFIIFRLQYAVTVVGLCFALAFIIYISQICSIKFDCTAKVSTVSLLRQSRYSLFFSLGMLFIWLLLFLYYNYNGMYVSIANILSIIAP